MLVPLLLPAGLGVIAYCLLQAYKGMRRSSVVVRKSRGLYWTDGIINGHTLTFLVDTGATDIVLNQEAIELLKPIPHGTDTLSSANGRLEVQWTVVEEIHIGPLVGRDICAVMVPGAVHNLLGLSFLEKTRFHYRDGNLVLEQ